MFLFNVIFMLWVDTVMCKPELKRHSTQVSWKDAFKDCEKFGGSDVFQDCQANTCNATRAAGKLEGLTAGNEQSFWVNGYVQRSPVVSYKGCFSVNEINAKNFNVTVEPEERLNALHYCASRLPYLERHNYLYMKISTINSSTLNLTPKQENKVATQKVQCFMSTTLIGNQVPYANCDVACGGIYKTMCGGPSQNGKHASAFFSTYEIQKFSLSSQLGKTCFKSKSDMNDRNLQHTFCNDNLKSACESYTSGAFKAYCNETTKSWFEAQNTCLSEKQHLQQKKEAPCMNANEDYWIGQFAVDTVTWNNYSVPTNASCLKLVVSKIRDQEDYIYRLELETCTRTLYPLCEIVNDSTRRNEFNDTSTSSSIRPFVKLSTTGLGEGITTTNDFKNTVDGTSIHPKNKTESIIGGLVGAVVFLTVIVLIVIFICKRKLTKYKQPDGEAQVQTHLDPETDAQYYRVNLPLTEVQALLGTTGEGVYNRLGDGEPEQTNTSSVALYDISGYVENEYDVSQFLFKHREDNDPYDISTISDDVYNTTSTNRDIPQRQGNDMYDL